ncbi:hypothetical protein BLOT_001368 [Blomia tropicalis]|nr:hypothetical protein BLOT_001368 [Blomia tropicalis]
MVACLVESQPVSQSVSQSSPFSTTPKIKQLEYYRLPTPGPNQNPKGGPSCYCICALNGFMEI